MSDEGSAVGVLARKIAKPAVAAEAPRAGPPMRALRMAVARASRAALGAEIAVIGVEVGVTGLDDLVGGLTETHCLVGLRSVEGLVGFAFADAEGVAAAGEMMTTGRIKPVAAAARPPTLADAMLLSPFLDELIDAIPRDCGRASPGDWFDDIVTGSKIGGTLALCLALPEANYRTLRMTLDLGAGGRQGEIAFVLPQPATEAPIAPEEAAAPDWGAALSEAVMEAPAEIEAILGRITIPLSQAEALSVGQILPLEGLEVGAVRLEGLDGTLFGYCRLGQSGGRRAIRIEPRPEAVLDEPLGLMSQPMGMGNPLDEPLDNPAGLDGLGGLGGFGGLDD